MKKEIAKSGITAEAGTNEQAIPQAEPDQPEGHTDEEGEPSVAKKVGAKGARKLLGGLRLAAKKAATFRADVTVDGGRAKVSSINSQSPVKASLTVHDFQGWQQN